MYRVVRALSDFQQTELRSQLTSLVLYEAVTTTSAKARNLVPFSNRFFNTIRNKDLGAKKVAHSTLLDKKAIAKVFEEILPRYKDSETTFVRSLKVANRKGDNAPQTMVALIAPLKVESPKAVEAKEAAKPKAAKPSKKTS
ncbi:MAG: L17 family ribosomal protein [Candidatus Berkelbacteria bacterium]|nr:MAG: L17 family ribosomal protein [Candidatus Berkelbacteria bacterium]QQG52121.1 MAG: L17 family ribosomal protein [Candidatus Berkelbacteria bacterium]